MRQIKFHQLYRYLLHYFPPMICPWIPQNPEIFQFSDSLSRFQKLFLIELGYRSKQETRAPESFNILLNTQ